MIKFYAKKEILSLSTPSSKDIQNEFDLIHNGFQKLPVNTGSAQSMPNSGRKRIDNSESIKTTIEPLPINNTALITAIYGSIAASIFY